jgi:hypothetical protein
LRDFSNTDGGFEPEIGAIHVEIYVELSQCSKCDAIEKTYKIACIAIFDFIVPAAICD